MLLVRLVMVAGVGLGLWVTLYRREGQRRDKIIVAVGRLRTCREGS